MLITSKENKDLFNSKDKNVNPQKNNIEFLQKQLFVIISLFALCVLIASLIFPLVKMYEKITICGTLVTFFLTIVYAVVLYYGIQANNSKLTVCIVWGSVGIVSVCQLAMIYYMQVVPKVDLVHIYNQVLTMLGDNSIVLTNKAYFGVYTNNIPITLLIYWVFRFGKSIGFTNYRVIGGVFNLICIWTSWVFIYRTALKQFGKKQALFLMGFTVINPMFVAYASYYYTDTISLPFLASAAYYLLTESNDSSISTTKSFLRHMLGGLMLAIAVKIRFTSIFLGLAIVTYMIVDRKLLKKSMLIAAILGFLFFYRVFSLIYQVQVPFETHDSSMPATHFLMMASKGYGNYNSQDVEFTLSFPTHEEKVENNLRVFSERIKNNGIIGNIRLILLKEVQVWAIGPHGFPQYIEYVKTKSRVYDLIRGYKSAWFFSYTQGYNAAFFLLMLSSVIMNRNKYSPFQQIIGIYLTGAIVFYVFWEAHPRHAFCIMIMSSFLLIPPSIPLCKLYLKQISKKNGV